MPDDTPSSAREVARSAKLTRRGAIKALGALVASSGVAAASDSGDATAASYGGDFYWTSAHQSHRDEPAKDADGISSKILRRINAESVLSFVGASWQEFGNPDSDPDSPSGCWRYTFQLHGKGSSIRSEMLYGADEDVDEETVTWFPSNAYFIQASSANPSLFDEWHDKFGELLRVQVADPGSESADDVAISARRDSDLFGFTNGEAVLKGLSRNNVEKDYSNPGVEPPAVAPSGDAKRLLETRNLDPSAYPSNVASSRQRLVKAKNDEKAAWSTITSLTSIGLSGAGVYVAAGSVLAGPIGWAGLALGVGAFAVFNAWQTPDGMDQINPSTGFKQTRPRGSGVCFGGHKAMFDVYVAPGENGSVEVESRFTLSEDQPAIENGNNIDSVPASSFWQLDISAPEEGGDPRDSEVNFDATFGEEYDIPQSRDPASYDIPSEKSQDPSPSIQLRDPAGSDEGLGLDLDDTVPKSVVLDATESVAGDATLDEFKWFVARLKDEPSQTKVITDPYPDAVLDAVSPNENVLRSKPFELEYESQTWGSAKMNYSFDHEGTYTIFCVAKDQAGNTGCSIQQVTTSTLSVDFGLVKQRLRGEKVEYADVFNVEQGVEFTLQPSQNEAFESYEWTIRLPPEGTPDGGGFEFTESTSPDSPRLSTTLAESGEFVVVLTAYKADGSYLVERKRLNVAENDGTGIRGVTLSISPENPDPGEAVEFVVSPRENSAQRITEVSWQFFGDTHEFEDHTDDHVRKSLVHSFDSRGEYEVAVDVVDDLGRTFSLSDIIQVGDLSNVIEDFEGAAPLGRYDGDEDAFAAVTDEPLNGSQALEGPETGRKTPRLTSTVVENTPGVGDSFAFGMKLDGQSGQHGFDWCVNDARGKRVGYAITYDADGEEIRIEANKRKRTETVATFDRGLGPRNWYEFVVDHQKVTADDGDASAGDHRITCTLRLDGNDVETVSGTTGVTFDSGDIGFSTAPDGGACYWDDVRYVTPDDGDDGGDDRALPEDFERDSLGEYVGDTSRFEIQSDFVASGNRALRGRASGDTNGVKRVGTDQYTLGQGDTFEHRFALDDGSGSGSAYSGNGGFSWCVQGSENGQEYTLSYAVWAQQIRLNVSRGPNDFERIASADMSFENETWYRTVVDHGTDGTITCRVESPSGESLAELSTTDETYERGGIGFASGSYYRELTYYWDDVRLTESEDGVDDGDGEDDAPATPGDHFDYPSDELAANGWTVRNGSFTTGDSRLSATESRWNAGGRQWVSRDTSPTTGTFEFGGVRNGATFYGQKFQFVSTDDSLENATGYRLVVRQERRGIVDLVRTERGDQTETIRVLDDHGGVPHDYRVVRRQTDAGGYRTEVYAKATGTDAYDSDPDAVLTESEAEAVTESQIVGLHFGYPDDQYLDRILVDGDGGDGSVNGGAGAADPPFDRFG